MTMPTLTMQRAHDEVMADEAPTLPDKPRRRTFPAEYKLRIVAEYDPGSGLGVIADGLTADAARSPSENDPARNPHRHRKGWQASAVRAILTPSDPGTALRELLARFLVKENAGSFEMHPAVRAYVSGRTTDAEQAFLALIDRAAAREGGEVA